MVKLVKIYDSFKIKQHHKNGIILIGNFDGLHLGHQKLFRLAKNYKKKIFIQNWSFDFRANAKNVF